MEMHSGELLRLTEGWTHYTKKRFCYGLIEATGQNLKPLKMLSLTSLSSQVMLIKSKRHFVLSMGF